MRKGLWFLFGLFLNIMPGELYSWKPEHLVHLNATGSCNFCDLRHLDSNQIVLAPGVIITDLSGSNLALVSFHNLNLQNANLSMADLRNATLENVNLKKAKLDSAIFKNAFLRNVCLKKTSVTYTNFEQAVFKKVDLRELISQEGVSWPADLNRDDPRRGFTTETGDSDDDSGMFSEVDSVEFH